MGKKQTSQRIVLVATVLAVWVALVPAIASAAPATPEETIAAIEAKEEAARNWIDVRADQYDDYLLTNPSASAAQAELDIAVSEMNARAAEAEVDISGKMDQHASNQDVQDAGDDAIANVWDTADSEAAAATASYNAYVAGSGTTTTSTTTTTTAPPTTTTSSTTTTVPATTTTTIPSTSTTTTVPPTTNTAVSTPTTTTTTKLQGSTTTTTTPVSTTTTTVPGSSTSTTTPPVGTGGPSEPPQSTAAVAALLRSGAATGPAQASPTTSPPQVAIRSASELAAVLELVRISLPPAVALPVVDLLMILRAATAAFISGARALAWPAGVLLVVIAVQVLHRSTPRRDGAV